ncbi:MAG: ParB/RepB/Spo0J family partition protein [Chloroflexota bacterium]
MDSDAPHGSGRNRNRKALGRGLDALLPATSPSGLLTVDIDSIERNPNQPRHRFERSALDDLAASIREFGVVQPLIVTAAEEGSYRIIVGERRWRAARLAGLSRVPVVVKGVSDRQTLELALIENVQRADLNPLEEAAAYQRLVQDYGLTQQQVAQQVGKSRVAITNTLRLLVLPETLKRAVIENRISEGHGRALLALSDQQAQLAMLERIERDDLSVRQTEALVRRHLAQPPPVQADRPLNPDIQAVEDDLRRALGTRVRLQPGKRGGRIVIEYYSEEDFQSLYRRLAGLE